MDITDITRQRSTCSDGSQPLASQKLIEADAASCCLILAKDFAHVWENSQCQWQWCVESSDTWSKLIQRRNCFLSLLDESWKSFWLHKVGGAGRTKIDFQCMRLPICPVFCFLQALYAIFRLRWSSLCLFQSPFNLQDATMALAENSSGQTAAEVAMRTFAQQT
jgi:hypothetical protein